MPIDPSTDVDLTAGFKQTLFTCAAGAVPVVAILGEWPRVGYGPRPTDAGFFLGLILLGLHWKNALRSLRSPRLLFASLP